MKTYVPNIEINLEASGEVVNLGIIDGYFHQLLEYAPFIINNRNHKFVAIANYPDSLIKLLDFFEISHSYYSSPSSSLNPQLQLRKNLNVTREIYTQKYGLYPSRESIETIRKEIDGKLKINSNTKYKEVLYLSRAKDTSERVVENEAKFLQHIGKTFDIDICTPSSLSLQEQFMRFSHAKVIMGAHGAGFSNIVFANKQTSIIEINGGDDIRWHYKTLSDVLGLHYSLVLTTKLSNSNFLLSEINVETIKTIMDRRLNIQQNSP
jgi:hypothetical protein